MIKNLLIVLSLMMTISSLAITESYYCPVTSKSDTEVQYDLEYLLQAQFSVKVREVNNETILSRCSYSFSAKKVTCDDYVVDRIEIDSNVGITKYYYFKGQFDFQIFSNKAFLENNGRGGIARGFCSKVKKVN